MFVLDMGALGRVPIVQEAVMFISTMNQPIEEVTDGCRTGAQAYLRMVGMLHPDQKMCSPIIRIRKELVIQYRVALSCEADQQMFLLIRTGTRTGVFNE
jgi:hypothetical protein